MDTFNVYRPDPSAVNPCDARYIDAGRQDELRTIFMEAGK